MKKFTLLLGTCMLLFFLTACTGNVDIPAEPDNEITVVPEVPAVPVEPDVEPIQNVDKGESVQSVSTDNATQSKESQQSPTLPQFEESKPSTQVHKDSDNLPSNLSNIEARAEVIITGRIIDDGTEKVTYGTDAPIQYGFTVYTLQITGVYVGDVVTGDTIQLIENHYTGDEDMYYDNNYLPSVKNKEYLFFLYKTNEDSPGAGAYFPAYAEYGRYPVIKSDEIKNIEAYTNDELGLGAYNSTLYRKILEDVIEKYMQ